MRDRLWCHVLSRSIEHAFLEMSGMIRGLALSEVVRVTGILGR